MEQEAGDNQKTQIGEYMWVKIPVSAVKWGLIALCAVAALSYLCFAPDSLKPWSSNPTVPAMEAAQPKPVVTIERVYIPGPERVQVIEKIKYIEKMPGVLTPSTASDNASHVIASAEIPPYMGKTIATAILEQKDGVGVGRIETKQLPMPFFAIQKEFGVRVGIGTGGLLLGELYARPVRIGPISVEVRGYGKRDDRSGADFGAAALLDYRF